MTNHDHAQHTTQQPSPGLRYLTVRINEQADDDDTGTLSPSNTGTSWSTVMLPWMSQQIDAMIALTKPDYSNIFACLDAYSQASMTAQSQALSDIIKLPTELFATSLSTQIQTIFESVKPDYSNIFAGLGAYCQVSKMSPPQGLADIFKPDGNVMFANMQIPSIVNAIKFETKSIASVTASFRVPGHVTKPLTSFAPNAYHQYDVESELVIWSTAYDLDTLRRREKVVAILKKSGIHYETPLFGAYDAYMRKNIDYERHVFTSMRTVLDHLVYACVKGILTKDLCACLDKNNIKAKQYSDKNGCIIRAHAAVLYLTIKRPIPEEKKKRLIQLSMKLNHLHEDKIQFGDLSIHQMILEMEILICEVFPDWLKLSNTTTTA